MGDKVKLTGTRYPKKPTSMFITICGFPPGATNCDVDLRHVKQITYTGTGKFKTKYKIAVTKFATASGKINCKKKQCVVGTTNALNPKDHATTASRSSAFAGSPLTPSAVFATGRSRVCSGTAPFAFAVRSPQ